MTNFEMILRTNESIRNDIIYHIAKDYCFDEKGRVITDKCTTECRWYDDINCTKRTEEWLREEVEE